MSDSSPSLHARQSSFDSIPFYDANFETSAENHCGHDACGGGGGGGGGVSSLYTGFCVIGAFCFAGSPLTVVH